MSLARTVPLSVLDLAPIVSGSNATTALRNSIDLARLVEQLGYTRYWVAEHHNMPGVASSSPPVIISHIASATERLRVGSGGVMLPNHPPLVVAEQFGTIEALHPGRIDLGIGRAPGTDQLTARALRRSADALSVDDFPQQLGELMAFFDGSFPPEHPYRNISAVPGLGNRPEIWLLGSSGYSAQVAGLLGLPFAFAHHFSAENTLPALELYRSRFEPSEWLAAPYAAIGVNVLAADDDARAEELALSQMLAFVRLRKGRPGVFPSPEEAAAYEFDDVERAMVEHRMATSVIGGPETVGQKLDVLLAETVADELIVTTTTFDHADRRHSYELLAKLRG